MNGEKMPGDGAVARAIFGDPIVDVIGEGEATPPIYPQWKIGGPGSFTNH